MENNNNDGGDSMSPRPVVPAHRDWAVLLVVGGILAGFLVPLSLLIAAAVTASEAFVDLTFVVMDLCVLDGRLWDGELWRLFTHTFVHFDFAHLFGNMLLLVPLMLWVRSITRSQWWLATYFTAAAAGGFLQIVTSPDALLLGASGGVAGLLGASLVACVRMIRSGRQPALAMIVLALCAFVLYEQVAGEIAAADPTVGHMAHIGGLACGFLLGFLVPLRGSPQASD
jgi:rhomboid protease GluP